MLASYGLHPAIQMLIMDNGSVFPSWYHLWQDLEFRHAPGLVTEVDLFGPEEKIAVFCDGAHHQRRKQRQKDEAINQRLLELDITPARVSGRNIVHDLANAGETVLDAVKAAQIDWQKP